MASSAERCLAAVLLAAGCCGPACAQDSAPAEKGGDTSIAEKLSNPVASLISVPLQFNDDSNFGPGDHGHKLVMNLQPVVPMALNSDWNLISRTILPFAHQSDVINGTGSQPGTGDITQSFFFSPSKPTSGGVVWGVGPAFLLPTASDPLLGGKKWGAGWTALVLRQAHGWTTGFLMNHLWSVASVHGYDNRPAISATFLQPFVAYNTPTAWTYSANLESSYDWHAHEFSVPLNLSVSHVMKIGRQPISLGGGVRYWLTSTQAGPHGWGYRAVVTFVFPR
jgi:hypothetical protein